MSVVKIDKILRLDNNSEQLWGCNLESLASDSNFEGYILPIYGWILGRHSSAVAIEMIHEGQLLERIPINILRFDVAKDYPNVPNAEYSGFSTAINLLKVGPKFELLFQVVFQDESRLLLWSIQGSRQSLTSSFQPKLQPLMITALGRVGTTWMMHLLSHHPQILIYRQYPYELKAFNAWMDILLKEMSLIDPVAKVPLINQDYKRIHQWLSRIYVRRVASFCQQSVEAFYLYVANLQGQHGAIYFAEKTVPGLRTQQLMWELYPQAREIFLVRNFKDMVCSIFAFNEKLGRKDFGHELFNDDKKYIQEYLRSSAQGLLQAWKQRADRAMLVRYEDLIEHPKEILASIFKYLEVDSSLTLIDTILEKASVDTPELREHRTTNDPKSSIGRWRRELDPSLQALCCETFDEILKEFGYDTG